MDSFSTAADSAMEFELIKRGRRRSRSVDFFVLVALKFGELWVLSQEQVLDLIRYNESEYADRPDC